MGVRSYAAEIFVGVELFLLYHWLLYTVIVCFFARNALAEKLEDEKVITDDASLKEIVDFVIEKGMYIGVLDSLLLFSTAFSAFSLQYQMVHHWTCFVSYSALGFAAVYGFLALYFSRQDKEFAILKHALAALAMVFATLAIPFAFDPQLTGMMWTLEATVVYVFATKRQQPHLRFISFGVYITAVIMQLSDYHLGGQTLLYGSFISTLITVCGGIIIFLTWQFLRETGSARWEINLQHGTLLSIFLYSLMLPMLIFSLIGTMMTWAFYSALSAFCQRRQANTTHSTLHTYYTGIIIEH